MRVGASRVSKIAKRQSAGDVIAPHVPTLTPTPLPMGEGLFAGVVAALLKAKFFVFSGNVAGWRKSLRADALLPSPAGRGIEGEGRDEPCVEHREASVTWLCHCIACPDPHPNPSPGGRGAIPGSSLRAPAARQAFCSQRKDVAWRKSLRADALPPSPSGRGIEGEGRGEPCVEDREASVTWRCHCTACPDPRPNPSPGGRGAIRGA